MKHLLFLFPTLLHLPLLFAHMQLYSPYPLRSPLNPSNQNAAIDYTAPLLPSGSDYPCKGYASDPFAAMTTYEAGQGYSVRLTGGETHGGGSCQISLSYDRGKTFRVIKSIIGSCPLWTGYKFVIPHDAPSGEALLAWTWFNRLGHREMYMNCAQARIVGNKTQTETKAETGGGTEVNHKNRIPVVEKRSSGVSVRPVGFEDEDGQLQKKLEEKEEAQDMIEVPFDKRPEIFRANIGMASECETIMGQDVIFPFPGPDVEYGHNMKVVGVGYACSSSTTYSVTTESCATMSIPPLSIDFRPSHYQHGHYTTNVSHSVVNPTTLFIDSIP